MVHEDHEHRDDAQQFDAGVPASPIRGSGMCRCDASGVRAGRGLAMGACGRHVFLFSFSLGHLSLTHEQSIQAK